MCQSLAGFVSLCLTTKDGRQAVIGSSEATTLGVEFSLTAHAPHNPAAEPRQGALVLRTLVVSCRAKLQLVPCVQANLRETAKALKPLV